ncbi:hypothetical protein MVES1_003601 [Malassezia vespertilionis]|uniref:Kinesin motor domain-containing protein n=1 Tax=Malassezia vespertilionis TaxID=2020962 RepID=A0A2N1J8H7_9BASI|nr:uncharacterized protein MVES1_003601 [Malassezia vespertilionis]PKI82772.1 hypothetical protein MVES_003172 [Malassezia vespertilionis]WFD08229.1 hypothetical protein MVES1_003601 [Malassezia vespertilionis]
MPPSRAEGSAQCTPGVRENVVVCVRMRPTDEDGGAPIWSVDKAAHCIVPTEQHPALARRAASTTTTAMEEEEHGKLYDFCYDNLVLGTESTDALYTQSVLPVVRSAMEGYNGTVFAYGQTGSGKTYTMSGVEHDEGVISRAVHDVFAMIRDAPDREFLLRISYLEIYNETLKDLLAPVAPSTPSRRAITRAPASMPRIVEEKGRVMLTGMQEEIVTRPAEVLALLERGQAARHVGETDWNTHSSRSHSVFQITIESRQQGDQSAVRLSQLNLIDLAGSERAASDAARRKEGAYINKSLLTLGTVIARLTEPGADAHIPYRDSKLTRLLQTSLSGDARVAVICTIATDAAAAHESLSTLKFGRRCKLVVTKARKQTIMDDKALLEQYRQELAQLRTQLDAPLTPPVVHALQEEHAATKQQVAEMQATRHALHQQIGHLTRLILTSRNVAAVTPQRSDTVDVFASPRRGPRLSDVQPRTPVGAPPTYPARDWQHEAELVSARRALEKARETAGALERQLDALRTDADEARFYAEEMKTRAEQARADAHAARVDADDAQQDAEQIRAELHEYRSEMDELHGLLAASCAELALLREDGAAQAHEAADVQARDLRTQLDAAHTETEAYAAELARAQSSIELLHAQWNNASAAMDAERGEEAQAEIDALRTELDTAHLALDAAHADLADVRSTLRVRNEELRHVRESHATDEAHREFRDLVTHKPGDTPEMDAVHLQARIAALERALAEEKATRDLTSLPERPAASPMHARNGVTPPRVPLRGRSDTTTPEPASHEALLDKISAQETIIATLNHSVDAWQARLQSQARMITRLAALVEGEGKEGEACVPMLGGEGGEDRDKDRDALAQVRYPSVQPVQKKNEPRGTGEAGQVRRARHAIQAQAQAGSAGGAGGAPLSGAFSNRVSSSRASSNRVSSNGASSSRASSSRASSSHTSPSHTSPSHTSLSPNPSPSPNTLGVYMGPLPVMKRASPKPQRAWLHPASPPKPHRALPIPSPERSPRPLPDIGSKTHPLPTPPERNFALPAYPDRRTLPATPPPPLVPSGSVAALRASLAAPPQPSLRAPTDVHRRSSTAFASVHERLAHGNADKSRAPPSHSVQSRLSQYTAAAEPRVAQSTTKAALHTAPSAPALQARRDTSILRELNDLRALPRVESNATMYKPPESTTRHQPRLSATAYKTDASHRRRAHLSHGEHVRAAPVRMSVGARVPWSHGAIEFPHGGELEFCQVYDNMSPSILRVPLRNTHKEPISLSLEGVHGVQWARLRVNANGGLQDWEEEVASNTVAWARRGGLAPHHQRRLRHMAANLEPVSTLTLGAEEAAALFVMVYVRDVFGKGSAALGPHMHTTDVGIEVVVGGARAQLRVHISASTPEYTMQVAGERAENAPAASPDGRERLLSFDLGDVVVGECITRTIDVVNGSEIACFTQFVRQDEQDSGEEPVTIRTQAHALVPLLTPPLASTDVAPVELAPYAHAQYTIQFEPHASCINFEQQITLVNMHAHTLSARLLLRANILGAAQDEALAVLSETPMDFGDCCGGQWTRQLLILKNTSDALLDVAFQAEKHVEATFQLAELAHARDTDEEIEDDVPLGGSSNSTWRRSPPPSPSPFTFGGARRASQDGSSVASQAGSRAPSPCAAPSTAHDSELSGAPSIAPVPSMSASVEYGDREPARFASYSVSALAPSGPAARSRRVHDPVAMLRGVGDSQHNQVEELVLRPGALYRVVVSYRPPRRDVDETYSAGRLQNANFCLFLDYARSQDSARAQGGRQRRTVWCHARTCTPFISVEPKIVDFGLADVGARKTAQIAVTNHSELSTRVLMRFVSKVLSMYMDEIPVPARQTVELKIDFFPRRVNNAYQKQITVMNLLNRHNDQIFDVRARNVDMQRISFHSLFYRILTKSGSNFIDFGDVNINSARVRSFAIENLCDKQLSLEMSVAHPEDLILYTRAQQHKQTTPEPAKHRSGTERKERFLETISTDVSTMARRALEARRSKGHKTPERPDLAAALKRGSRGRATQTHGKSVAFRDRSLLRPLAYLDLASGPPRDASKLSAKARRTQRLQSMKNGPAASPRIPRTLERPETPANAVPVPLDGSPRPRASPALTGKWRTASLLANPGDVAQLDLDALIAALEGQPSSLSSFFTRNLDAEERMVRTEINLKRALRQAIDTAQLVPIGMLQVPPRAEVQVVAVYTPNGSTRPHIQGTARKQDSRIFLRLLEFDARRAQGLREFAALREKDVDELPVRDLMVRSTVCRSMLELGQPHINFGIMDKGDVRERKIWVQNRSEWALRYYIRKSGSIASGDIRLGLGRYGIVPGYGKRGVDFTFSPSLSGPFYEKLMVENVADYDNDQALVLKASARKVPNFSIDPTTLDFGTCRAPHASMPESVLLTNTTSKRRKFVLYMDEARQSPIPLDVLVSVASDAATRRALSREEEEEVETLLQKLKIAHRKGNVDKLAKYQDRLRALGVPIAAQDNTPPQAVEHAVMEDDVQFDYTLPSPSTRSDAGPGMVPVHLDANQSVKLLLRLRIARRDAEGEVHVAINVHEAKNSDETRSIATKARVEPSTA